MKEHDPVVPGLVPLPRLAHGKYQQIGNAVPPMMARVVAEAVLLAMTKRQPIVRRLELAVA